MLRPEIRDGRESNDSHAFFVSMHFAVRCHADRGVSATALFGMLKRKNQGNLLEVSLICCIFAAT